MSAQDEIAALIEAIANGEEGAKLDRLVALLKKPPAPEAILFELRDRAEETLRVVFVRAAARRTEPAIREALRALVADASARVRFEVAQALSGAEDLWISDALERLLRDTATAVVAAAIHALRVEERFLPRLLELLDRGDLPDRASIELVQKIGLLDGPGVLERLLKAMASDDWDSGLRSAAAAALATLLGRTQFAVPAQIDLTHVDDALAAARKKTITATASLTRWLEATSRTALDPRLLQEFGADLTALAEAGTLPRSHGGHESVSRIVEALFGKRPHAAVLLGESGVGKTNRIHELVHQLRNRDGAAWRVLQLSIPTLLEDAQWLGKFETRVQRLLSAASRHRRVVLYIPDLAALMRTGRTIGSNKGFAELVRPVLESGDICIVTESGARAFDELALELPWVRSTFAPIQIGEADEKQTRLVVDAVARELGVKFGPGVRDDLLQLAEAHLPGQAQPGRALGLLRRVAAAPGAGEGPVTTRLVLETLADATGIPVDFFDDEVPLEAAQVHTFLEQRVLGQAEAIDAVADIVLMAKAGLSDPRRPLGVLLFCGPTGVGKTELARSLAELLFGDPARLVRLDMSEYAAPDSFERLLGRGERPGTLTHPVLAKPFSVVLLDEVEKAHVNVFDLCLQIFDAGRLTDGHGRTVDFRRTIVVLTSNIGSHLDDRSSVGFGSGPQKPASRDDLLRELGQWFRPEFLNRIDRIVPFRALAEETAEKIARAELARVLKRSGIERRHLTVEVDPSVPALLVRLGYSKAFGGRALKRTVEQQTLIPLARVMAAGKAKPGSLVRLLVRGDAIEARLESATPEPTPAAPKSRDERRLADLAARAATLEPRLLEITDRKSELVQRSADPSFWNDKASSARVLDELHRLESLLDSAEKVRRRLLGLSERAAMPRRSVAAAPRRAEPEILKSISEDLDRIEILSRADSEALDDTFVILRRTALRGSSVRGVERLAGMILKRTDRWGLNASVLGEGSSDSSEELAVLSIEGAGAQALLQSEHGTHIWLQPREGASSQDREVVRVEVIPQRALDGPLPEQEFKITVRVSQASRGLLLEAPKHVVEIVHLPSKAALQMSTGLARSEARDRSIAAISAWVRAQASKPHELEASREVRRYELGASPRYKDLRTGRQSGRLEELLEGS